MVWPFLDHSFNQLQIVNLWGYTLNYANSASQFFLIEILTIGINTIVSVIGLYYLGLFLSPLFVCSPHTTFSSLSDAAHSRGYKQYIKTIGFILFLFTHSLSLLAFSLYLLVYGHLIKSKITQPSTSSSSLDHSPSNIARILIILQRINWIMTTCGSCYAFRISMIFLKLYSLLCHADDIIPPLSPSLWFVITDLIPSLLPNLCFLYVMRITTLPPSPLSSSSPDVSPSEHEERLLTAGYHNRSWFYQDTESINLERESILSLTNTHSSLRRSTLQYK
jgi:hypothetical protein